MKLQKQLIVIIPQIKYLLLTILIIKVKIKEPNKEPKPYAVPKLPYSSSFKLNSFFNSVT